MPLCRSILCHVISKTYKMLPLKLYIIHTCMHAHIYCLMSVEKQKEKHKLVRINNKIRLYKTLSQYYAMEE